MADVQKENGFTVVANELLERLIGLDLPARTLRVWLYLARNSYGWSRTWAPIQTYREIGAAVKIHRMDAYRALHLLLQCGMLKKTDDRYVLVKDYELWITQRPPSPKGPPVFRGLSLQRLQFVTPAPTRINVVKEKRKGVASLKDKEAIRPVFSRPVDNSPQAHLVEQFSRWYVASSGMPYQESQVDYILAARLLRRHGPDVVIQKAQILRNLCADRAVWFTKGGWSDFTIGRLAKHWNSILPDTVLDKDADLIRRVKELNDHDQRLNSGSR